MCTILELVRKSKITNNLIKLNNILKVVRCSKFERIKEYHFLTQKQYLIITDSEIVP